MKKSKRLKGLRTVKNLDALSKGFDAVKKLEVEKTQRRCGKIKRCKKTAF
jgi:hypothetical protein